MAPEAEARLAEVYDAGAVSYERHWAPALLRHSLDLVELLPGGDGPRTVLEVAAGTGSLLPRLVDVAGPSGRVVALDRSIGMLHRVRTPVPRVQADAQRLPVRPGSVDVAVAAFVLFLLPDAERAVREIARVMRPGGYLLATTWGEQRSTLADELYRDVLTELGAPEPGQPPRSDTLTDSPAAMRALLDGAGLADVRTTGRQLDARFTPEDLLDMRTTCGQPGWRFAQLSPEVQAQARIRLQEEYAALGPTAFTDTSEVLLTVARKPG